MRKLLLIGGIVLGILIITGVIATVIILSAPKKASDSNIETPQISQKLQTVVLNNITLTGTPDCTIPDKVLMTDFLGYPLATLVAKYGGVSQIHPEYVPQVIVCENDNYFIRINAWKTDMIASYIEIQEKEFGSCDAGISRVLPWVDKSMLAVGLDPTNKGAATYDTEDNRSDVEYNDYILDGKKTQITIACTITGDYIDVLAVQTN